MSIYLSNALYVSYGQQPASRNRPTIGWKSVLRPSDITVDYAHAGDANQRVMWSPDTYSYWQSAAVFSATPLTCYINLSNPGGAPVDYVGIAGHNFGSNSTGTGYVLNCQHSFDGTTWVDTTPAIIPADNRAIMLQFEPLLAQYFRLKVVSSAWESQPGRTGVVFSIAHLRMGESLRLQMPIYVGASPFLLDKKVEKITSVSDNGKYLGTMLKSVVHKYAFTQKNNSPDFIRQSIAPFLDHCDLIGGGGNGPKGSFFAAWRPYDYPDEVLYCHPPSSIDRPENQRSNGMMGFSLSGEAEA